VFSSNTDNRQVKTKNASISESGANDRQPSDDAAAERFRKGVKAAIAEFYRRKGRGRR